MSICPHELCALELCRGRTNQNVNLICPISLWNHARPDVLAKLHPLPVCARSPRCVRTLRIVQIESPARAADLGGAIHGGKFHTFADKFVPCTLRDRATAVALQQAIRL